MCEPLDQVTENKMVGTCMNMCPLSEIQLREREKLLHPFEVSTEPCDKPSRRPRADPSKTVKQFSRPAVGKADASCEELRPPPVLRSTVDYLLTEIPCKPCQWSNIYDFVFDRLRAIRQDLVIQDVKGDDSIAILEKAVRFHIYSDYRLCTAPIAVFDQKINNQHTQECLKRLLKQYKSCTGSSQNRAEFEALYLLFNLGDAEALTHFYTLDTSLRNDSVIQLAYQCSLSYVLRDWVRVVRLGKKFTSPLFYCALHRHMSDLQRHGLLVMNTAYSSKVLKFPSKTLVDLLNMNSQSELEDVCLHLGIVVQNGNVTFSKASGFKSEKIPRKKCHAFDKLLESWSIPDILHGRTGSPSQAESLWKDFQYKCSLEVDYFDYNPDPS